MTLGTEHISDDDLVLFALQLLPDDRMRQAMPHLQACSQCRSEIAKIQGDLAAYSTTAAPQAPPPSARDRFTRQIAREPRVAELPAFELKPTEFDLREQERLAQFAPPEPPAPLASASAMELFSEPSQDRVRNGVHERIDDRSADRNAERNAERAAERTAERNADRGSNPPLPDSNLSEPVFPARQSRTRREDSLEDDQPVAPRRQPEPAFPVRQSRSLSEDSLQDDAPRQRAEPSFPARQSRSLRTQTPEEHEDRFEERRRPRRAPWILAWTGWAVAAGCSFVAGLQLHQRQQVQSTVTAQQAKIDDMQKQAVHAQDAQVALSTLTSANAMQVALHPTPPLKPAVAVKGAPPVVPPEALAAYLADKGALVFVATHLQPAPAGKTYELWLLPANGQNPIPAGTFKPDTQGCASVVMPRLPTGVQAKGFGVTVENDGGSQTPTMPIVMS
jgi:anti-sigma-K factor RskA